LHESDQSVPIETAVPPAGVTAAEAAAGSLSGVAVLPVCPPAPPRSSDATMILTLGAVVVLARVVSRGLRRRHRI